MELRHLRYFLAVAEERQFTRAAQRLAIQQPPLSQQIRLFEDELGFALFERQSRGVELTAAGRAFAQDAERVLATLQQGVENARRIAQGEIGTISVGITSSAGFHPATTDQIRAFRAAHPGVGVELAELNAAEILERLQSGQIHAAFLRKPVDTPEDIAFERLLDEPMVIVLPAVHPLLRGAGARRMQLSLEALRNEDFIFVRRPGAPGMYADIVSACRVAGYDPHVVHEVPRMLSAINLVAAGLGVTLVPASMQRYAHASVVYRKLVASVNLRAPLHLAYPKHAANRAATRFVDFVIAQRRASGR